jgi:hypothetical protein
MGLALGWILYWDDTVGAGSFRSTHPSVLRTMKTFNNIEINNAATS